MRWRRVAWLTMAAVFNGACAVQDAVGPEVVVPVEGNWHYVSDYQAPAPVAIDGTLRLAVDNTGGVTGSASWIERTAGAADRAVAGTLTGRGVDAKTVEFDVTIDGGIRRHVGTVTGDSLTGSWVLTSGSATPVGSRFRASRVR